jgi:hypothetical protein
MPSATYYRDQAKLFLTWTVATTNPELAAILEARAREFLARADWPEEPAYDLKSLLDGFNEQQRCKVTLECSSSVPHTNDRPADDPRTASHQDGRLILPASGDLQRSVATAALGMDNVFDPMRVLVPVTVLSVGLAATLAWIVFLGWLLVLLGRALI